MSHFASIAGVCGAVAITIVSGVWHRQITHQWGDSGAQAAAARFDQLPEDVGLWKLEESFEIEPAVDEILRCAGYLHRRYVHRDTAKAIDVIVMVGPSDTMSVHTPEVCYRGAGFMMEGKTRTVEVKSADREADKLGLVSMRHIDDASSALLVAYGWSLGETFALPSSPRWAFRHVPYLYKIQAAVPVANHMSTSNTAKEGTEEESLLKGFLGEFLATLRPNLVPVSQ